MSMNVRQQIREALRKDLEALGIFKSVHKDKWQPMTEDEVPACRVELTTETVERLDETNLSLRTPAARARRANATPTPLTALST